MDNGSGECEQFAPFLPRPVYVDAIFFGQYLDLLNSDTLAQSYKDAISLLTALLRSCAKTFWS